MFKPLAFAIAAGLLLAIGCEKKLPSPAELLSNIPTRAPEASKGPGTVFEHLQYAMVRKDPKHLENFCPADDKPLAMGTTQMFHNHAGYYGLGLTPEEVETLGLQEFVEAGWISEKWTTRDLKDAMEGKRDPESGMEKLSEFKLDMPYVQADKKTIDKLNKELIAALEKKPAAIYAGGLYRLLKGIPELAWATTSVIVGTNPKKEMHDLVLKIEGEVHYATIAVGKNADGTMYIDVVKYEKSPAWLAKKFSEIEEAETGK
ncbi:MAG: hypothetical protein LBQ86_00225 [Holophagales bacterium]|nr:hypothetical protein [Holophagales bacterium]